MIGRLVKLVATAGVLVLSACGGGEMIVQAQAEGEGGEPTPIRELPVRALPYDREVIFDSLKAIYPEPEPEVPDSLADLQDRMTQAQQRWRDAEARWNAARDSLRALRDGLAGVPRQSARYRLLFADFGEQEDRERAAGRQSVSAFNEFDALQKRFTAQAQELRVRRDMWGDQAYAAVDSVIVRRIEALGRDEAVDTTDASGVVRFTLEPGQWWIHARYDLPFEELYWNVPVEVQRGDPIQLILNRSNAQVRPKL